MPSTVEKLLVTVNTVRDNKGLPALADLKPQNDLRNDLGFDSLDLAELTVRIEKEHGIDIFADGFVLTVAEILAKLER
ncbi:MAG TPA: acyl carrier protein [bacterium]|nr:acyl carrier protein [bacterium]HQI48036.1 acyl carrier protein [bacterium]HQJ66504.1 acyl carrier protein [bacterium]